MGTSWIAAVSMTRGRTEEKEEILEGLRHRVDVAGPHNELLFHGMDLLVKGPGLLLNGQMILLGRHDLQNDCCIKKQRGPFACTTPPSCTSPLIRLVVALYSSHRRLLSAGASASHRAVTSCPAPLEPLIRLVVTLPLLTPPPPL